MFLLFKEIYAKHGTNPSSPVFPGVWLEKQGGMEKMYMNKIKAIAVSLAFFAVTACGGGSGGDVSVVKKGKLQRCPDFTVEEMFDAFLEKPKWQRVTENNIDYVNVSGVTAGSGKPVNVFMQFWVRNDNFGVQAVEINGEVGEDGDVLIILNRACMFAIKAAAEKARVISADPIKDSRDGKTYKTVKIGEQIWMAENLNIEMGKSVCNDFDETKCKPRGSVCYGNEEANCKKYGRLYDWETAMKACPSGWHLPSGAEWEKLTGLAGLEYEFLKAKSGWNSNGTDNYGFSALPGGYFWRFRNVFFNVGTSGSWWATTGTINIPSGDKSFGDKDNYFLSVRCVKD
jgi:uncharacterized protein (TIGR02145 family)